MLTELHWWQRVLEVRTKRKKFNFSWECNTAEPSVRDGLDMDAFRRALDYYYENNYYRLTRSRPVHPLASGAD